MGRIFLPPKVARELRDETSQYAAAISNACHKDHVCNEWDRELRRLDPYLHMVRAPDYFVIGTPLLPGLYHLIRENPGAPPSVTPIQTPDGGFMYPPGRLLEQLKSMDLQDVRVDRMRKRIAAAEAERQERAKAVAREERLEHAKEVVASVTRTQVSMNRDTPWAQNATGFRRTRGRRVG